MARSWQKLRPHLCGGSITPLERTKNGAVVEIRHGDPAADQVVCGPSGGCPGDLISTPDFFYSRVFYKLFLWGNLRFGGCFEKPSLQVLFWCKKLRSGQKIGKATKRRRSVKPTSQKKKKKNEGKERLWPIAKAKEKRFL